MNAITFDSLSTARRLRERGLLQEHAEAIADELRAASQTDLAHLATREELGSFKSEMRADFALIRSEMREAESRTEARLKDMQLKLGSMIVALGGILVAVKYFG